MLARTFVDSPLIQHVMPDRTRREATGRWMFGANLQYGLRYGEVWAAFGADGAVQGAAVWWAPEYVDLDEERGEETGFADGMLVVGPAAWQRLDDLGKGMADLHQRAAPDPHWYLAVIGVEPSLQGQGIAGAILRPTLDRLDAERLPAYLETGQPRNVAYYPRYGFEVVGEVTVSPGGLTLWGMRRDPRQPTAPR
jgi:ribosomal protein S18 acetylase RimI-like enzyme